MKPRSLDALMSEDESEDTGGGLTDAAKDIREAIEEKDDEALASALQRFVTLADEDVADEGDDEDEKPPSSGRY